MSRLFPTYFARNSNLLLIEFINNMTYDNPVWIFVSKMLKFPDVISIFLTVSLERRFPDFADIL